MSGTPGWSTAVTRTASETSRALRGVRERTEGTCATSRRSVGGGNEATTREQRVVIRANERQPWERPRSYDALAAHYTDPYHDSSTARRVVMPSDCGPVASSAAGSHDGSVTAPAREKVRRWTTRTRSPSNVVV